MPTISEEPLDPRSAMELLNKTHSHTAHALDVRTDLLYAVWGVVWLVGIGSMYLSVRGQSPYRGPDAWSGILMAVLVLAAVGTTIVVTRRATRGVGGDASVQGTMYGLSWFVGFAALFAIEGGLARHGASDVVMGLVASAGPMLVVALIYLGGGALWREVPMYALGVWLAVLAAVGAMTGPVTILLIGGLGGGLAFLAAAALMHARMRSV